MLDTQFAGYSLFLNFVTMNLFQGLNRGKDAEINSA